VVRCTHYVAGASEIQYLNRNETPEITFVERDAIERSHESFVEGPFPGEIEGRADAASR
jgi:hypothetical protein